MTATVPMSIRATIYVMYKPVADKLSEHMFVRLTCVSVKRKTVLWFCTPACSYSFLRSSWKAE